jgi:hypothetical protein
MGNLIKAGADTERVKAHVRTAYDRAIKSGGGIEAAARLRMGEAVAALAEAGVAYGEAAQAEEGAWNTVLVESAKCELAIGAARDALWNALGRPRPSPAMDKVFPDGVLTYLRGEKGDQPEVMGVLASRILAVAPGIWPAQLRAALAADITTHRESLQRALDAHRPTKAAARIARSVYRAAVQTAHDRLRAFKRDLLSLGMTEAAIHEIIPDASRPEHGDHTEGASKKAA